jgi:hypothetical protein
MRPLLALAICLLLALDDVEPTYRPAEVTPPVERLAPCMDMDCCEHNPDTCQDPDLYPDWSDS